MAGLDPLITVALVGSRTFTDRAIIARVVARLADRYPRLLIISGGARGADTLAIAEARRARVPWRVYKARWRAPDGKVDLGAGHARNATLVALADVVVAFLAPGPPSPGTSGTIRLAEAAGKPCHVFHAGLGWVPADNKKPARRPVPLEPPGP